VNDDDNTAANSNTNRKRKKRTNVNVNTAIKRIKRTKFNVNTNDNYIKYIYDPAIYGTTDNDHPPIDTIDITTFINANAKRDRKQNKQNMNNTNRIRRALALARARATRKKCPWWGTDETNLSNHLTLPEHTKKKKRNNVNANTSKLNWIVKTQYNNVNRLNYTFNTNVKKPCKRRLVVKKYDVKANHDNQRAEYKLKEDEVVRRWKKRIKPTKEQKDVNS
jgi:hypothetical protein